MVPKAVAYAHYGKVSSLLVSENPAHDEGRSPREVSGLRHARTVRQTVGSRHLRSNGRRQPRGAMSWWIWLGP